MTHRAYIAAFAIALTLLQSGFSVLAADVKNVGPEEFDKLRAKPNAVVLDVRTAKEYATGHIPGAVNIDWYLNFEKSAANLDKSKTYLVHCAAGVRSSKAAEKMRQLNFPNVYNLEGGFKAWEKAGKPVEKAK